MQIELTKPLKISDWVLIKKYNTTSRVVDIQSHPDGYFLYGVLDRIDKIHYLKADELVKMVEER